METFTRVWKTKLTTPNLISPPVFNRSSLRSQSSFLLPDWPLDSADIKKCLDWLFLEHGHLL